MKYCKNCGKELENGICKNCNQKNKEKQKKSSTILIIIILIIVIVIILGLSLLFMNYIKNMSQNNLQYSEYEEKISSAAKIYLSLNGYELDDVLNNSNILLDDMISQGLINNKLNNQCKGYSLIKDNYIKSYIKCSNYKTYKFNDYYTKKTNIKVKEKNENDIKDNDTENNINNNLKGFISNNKLSYTGAAVGDTIEFEINDKFKIKAQILQESNDNPIKITINDKKEETFGYSFWYYDKNLNIPFSTIGNYLILVKEGTDILSTNLFIYDTEGNLVKNIDNNYYDSDESGIGVSGYKIEGNNLTILTERISHGPSIRYNGNDYSICSSSLSPYKVQDLSQDLPVKVSYTYTLENNSINFDNVNKQSTKNLSDFLNENSYYCE